VVDTGGQPAVLLSEDLVIRNTSSHLNGVVEYLFDNRVHAPGVPFTPDGNTPLTRDPGVWAKIVELLLQDIHRVPLESTRVGILRGAGEVYIRSSDGTLQPVTTYPIGFRPTEAVQTGQGRAVVGIYLNDALWGFIAARENTRFVIEHVSPYQVVPTPPPPTQPPPSPQTNTVTLTLINRFDRDVCYVYISPVDSETWGADWLGESETIPPGASRTFDLTPGTYDLLATDCNEETLVETYGLDLSRSGTWELVPTPSTPGGVTLTAINGTDTPVCYILISPSDSEEWERTGWAPRRPSSPAERAPSRSRPEPTTWPPLTATRTS
jgi:hypothetical protein